MNEFIGVLLNVLFLKSIAIMQTNLCIADLEMLFTTLRTCVNCSSAKPMRATTQLTNTKATQICVPNIQKTETRITQGIKP